MCGIVGHIGNRDSKKIVLEGLKRLEYRGYDSAGITLFDPHIKSLVTIKKAGKLNVLASELKDCELLSHLAIGHTRWATHGKVSDLNAHPHVTDRLALVHNGIIENNDAIRDSLLEKGYRFSSQTDSEVFLKCVDDQLKQRGSLQQAFASSFEQIKGNSAFVLMDADTESLFCIKRGAPLVCGKNKETGEVFVSSDPYALVGLADHIFFPENDVLVKLSAEKNGHIEFFDLNGEVTDRYSERIQSMDLKSSEKGEHDHYMLKEIYEQPELIRKSLEDYRMGTGLCNMQKIIASVDIQRLHIVGCGTAYHAGLCLKRFFEQLNRIYAFVHYAHEFRYENPLLKPKDGGIFISQSGETADTLAAQELCQQKNIPTMSIVNVEGSTLYRQCDYNLLINAGFEIGVASTKAFTQMVLTGFLMSRAIEEKMDHPEVENEISLLAQRFEQLIERADEIKNVAKALYNYKGYLFTGRGKYFPVALEGALKLKEIAYVHAEGYPAGELKHGPIALIDEDMVNVALIGPELYDKTLSNLEEVKARNGVILAIGPKEDHQLGSKADYYIPIDFDGIPNLSPLLVNLELQLLAYYIALYKGTDIDKPRNLAKSVTVE